MAKAAKKNTRLFGTLPDGTPVYEYTYRAGELSVSVLDYGATVTSIVYKGKEMVLGYDDLEGYLNGGAYIGATVGRYANRIAGGKFTLNGREYDVGANEKKLGGHLHGGVCGFDKRMYSVSRIGKETVFSRRSPDGEEGYPGNLDYSVGFRLDNDTLVITYRAVSDADTVFNMTNHSYFDPGLKKVGDLVLEVGAEYITPVNERLIPEGGLMKTLGTPFDFTVPKRISDALSAEHPQLDFGAGVDHNFVLGDKGVMKRAARVYSPDTGFMIECFTDMPGIQIYTSNCLDENAGRGGEPLKKHQGICLETQFYPDTPNRPDFPSCLLRAGEEFVSVTKYKFKKV